MHILLIIAAIVIILGVGAFLLMKKKERFTATQMRNVNLEYSNPNKNNTGNYQLGYGYSVPTRKNYDKIPVYNLITVDEMPGDIQLSRIGTVYDDFGNVLDVYRSEYKDVKIAYYFVNSDFQYLLFKDTPFEDGDQAVFMEFRYNNPFTFSIRQGQFGPQE